MKLIYQNAWCRIINKGGYYILQSKSAKYNNQYFSNLADALKAIGIDVYSQNIHAIIKKGEANEKAN
jgi:hypothetical protein